MVLSVIIPVYNAEKYISDCVESILTQSFSDFELLLIDDGSLDKSREICEDYSKKDSRVRVFHKENGGAGSARNLGIDKAQGEYIHFVDADDYVLPGAYQYIVDRCLNTNPDIVYLQHLCDSKVPVNAAEAIETKYDSIHEFLKTRYVSVYVWKKIFKKLFLIKNGIRYPDIRIYTEDCVFVWNMFQYEGSIVESSAPIYSYSTIADSIVNNRTVPHVKKAWLHFFR